MLTHAHARVYIDAMSKVHTMESLQDEYFKVASVLDSLRSAGHGTHSFLPLWYYQASLLAQMDKLSKKV